MIDDPDHPDYRYPRVGERLWHVPWGRWVTVRKRGAGVPEDEVPVILGSQMAVVKLKSLEERS